MSMILSHYTEDVIFAKHETASQAQGVEPVVSDWFLQAETAADPCIKWIYDEWNHRSVTRRGRHGVSNFAADAVDVL